VIYGAQAVFDPYMAASFCKAINDWIAAEWLSKDARLRASIVVPMQAPDLAVEEIERRANDDRFVSVLVLSQGETLLGRRHHWPVYQAAEKYKLPIAIHAGSQYRGAPSSIGWPSYRYEYYLAEAQAFQAQVLSLIYEGVFGKFPGLKVVLMESGVSWLPAFMWRANKTWRGVRVEVPWVEREPASIMRDHIRVTMQPFDGPPDAAGVADVIEQIGSDKMFLFASDYPHWQFDGDDPMPPHLPASLVTRMCADNPLETFPRLKLAA
jgi:predicted TIM-barrel fold metal-dependent hydrolase